MYSYAVIKTIVSLLSSKVGNASSLKNLISIKIKGQTTRNMISRVGCHQSEAKNTEMPSYLVCHFEIFCNENSEDPMVLDDLVIRCINLLRMQFTHWKKYIHHAIAILVLILSIQRIKNCKKMFFWANPCSIFPFCVAYLVY